MPPLRDPAPFAAWQNCFSSYILPYISLHFASSFVSLRFKANVAWRPNAFSDTSSFSECLKRVKMLFSPNWFHSFHCLSTWARKHKKFTQTHFAWKSFDVACNAVWTLPLTTFCSIICVCLLRRVPHPEDGAFVCDPLPKCHEHPFRWCAQTWRSHRFVKSVAQFQTPCSTELRSSHLINQFPTTLAFDVRQNSP